MNEYPDCETYKALYKRFYDGRQPAELLDLAGNLKDKIVLDICAGDGRLSLEAIKRGASRVFFIEKEEKMFSKELRNAVDKNTYEISPHIGSAKKILRELRMGHFDIAFCRQGVNYWLNESTAKSVADVVMNQGLFIFNTFNAQPSEKPILKTYELDGKKFGEVSWLVGDTVHHVQIREGLPPHTTSFRWLSPEYLKKILSPYFNIQLIVDGSTSIYRCSRK